LEEDIGVESKGLVTLIWLATSPPDHREIIFHVW